MAAGKTAAGANPGEATASRVPLEAQFRPEEARAFADALDALERAGIPFLIAGAFGLFRYTRFWRGTKDLDLLILPEHRERAVAAVLEAGLLDLYPLAPYDRDWIFRSHRGEVIVDLIWQLANKVDRVDGGWFARGLPGRFLGREVRYAAAADLCWMKLFVLQPQRCDWPDILNVIRGTRGQLDWDRLLKAAGEHWRLLCSVVELYDWLCPAERHFIPARFREALEALRRRDADRLPVCRATLLDSRPWLTEPGAAWEIPDLPGADGGSPPAVGPDPLPDQRHT